MWTSHPTEYYSATKWNKVQVHAIVWKNLKNTMLQSNFLAHNAIPALGRLRQEDCLHFEVSLKCIVSLPFPKIK